MASHSQSEGVRGHRRYRSPRCRQCRRVQPLTIDNLAYETTGGGLNYRRIVPFMAVPNKGLVLLGPLEYEYLQKASKYQVLVTSHHNAVK